MNQSFREQEDEEDYGDEQDANIFDATKVPDAYDRPDNQYYDQQEEAVKEGGAAQ